MTFRPFIEAVIACMALQALGLSELNGSTWSLVPCGADSDATARQFEVDVRGATENDPDFVPIPFPVTVEQLATDFEAQVSEIWAEHDAEVIPARYESLLALREAGKLSYQRLEVAEWRMMHCTRTRGTMDAYLLLRVFNEDSGTELARASLDVSGLLNGVTFAEPSTGVLKLVDGHELAEIASAQAAAASSGLVSTSGFQYAAIASPTIPCHDSVPCIVFRSGEVPYIYRAGRTYRLRSQEVRISNSQFVADGTFRDSLESSWVPGNHLVSLGGDELTIAVELPTLLSEDN